MEEETWLTRPQFARRINVPVATPAQWASQGKGPKYAKFGRHVRYRLSDVIAWELANTVQRTDDTPSAAADDPVVRRGAGRRVLAGP